MIDRMDSLKRLWHKLTPELWLLYVIAAATRLIGIGSPKNTVFDEIYFKAYASYYYSHQYYFDIHPPLGKLILAGWEWLIRANPATLTNQTTTSSRIIVAIAGIGIVAVVYGITRRLSQSRLSAGIAGLIVALDGALIVESRFVLVDSFLIFFGLAAVYTALRFRDHPNWGWLIGCGLLMGAAASIKWTGLAPDLVAAVILYMAAKKHDNKKIQLVSGFIVVVILSLAVYMASFAIHFSLLDQSGTGDAFMSEQFQSTLKGNQFYDPSVHLSYFSKFIQLNKEMYEANESLTATHPYSSKWYSWPVMYRPVYYWQGPTLSNGKQGNIYLIGNPVSWWLGTLAVIASAVLVLVPKYRKYLGERLNVFGILLFAYAVCWLPFIFIGRVMFLYHYLFAYIFSIMMLSILVGTVIPNKYKNVSPRRMAAILLCVLVIAGFAFFAPLVYGWPLSQQGISARTWFSSWR